MFDYTCVGWKPPRPPKVTPLELPERPIITVPDDPRPAIPEEEEEEE